ncbi:MAG: BatA domain-containing protein [Phycisphaerales bacterium]
MSFLHLQLALAGFACVAIPIIIHLLMRRRRKPIMWGAMRFLLEAYRKQRRKLMIEKWLLLLTRCLLVAAIAGAVARPLLGELLGGSSGRTLYVVIDNSLAAQARGGDGRTALERHKQTAAKLLDALGAIGAGHDRAAVVALGAPAEGVVLPASADLTSVRGSVDALDPTDSRADVAGALSAVSAAIERDRNDPSGRWRRGPVYVALLSDFLMGSSDTGTALGKLPAEVRVLATEPGEARANVRIVGIEPERSVLVTGTSGSSGPGEAGEGAAATGMQIRVLLRRSGPSVAIAETSHLAVSMLTDEAGGRPQVSRGQVRWSPGQESATGVVQLQSPARSAAPKRSSSGVSVVQATIERTESAAGTVNVVAGDDVWRRPIPVREALRVGIVSPRRFGDTEGADRLDPADWARLALRPGDGAGVELVEVDPSAIDGARLAGLDAVVLARPDLVPGGGWRRLKLFIEGGGLVMLFPAPVAGAQLWTDAMTQEMGIHLKLAREAKTYGSPEKGEAPMTLAVVAPPAPASDGAGTGNDGSAGGRARGVTGGRDLLGLIRGELDELLKPVSVWQTLPIEGASAGEGTTILSLADGSPLVWVTSVSDRSRGGSDGPGETSEAAAPGGEKRGEPARGQDATGGGLLVYFAAALDLRWTDLPAKPLVVPLIQEVLREGIGQSHGSWSVIAGALPVLPERTAELRVDPRAARGESGAQDAEHEGVVAVGESGAATLALRRAQLWRAVDDRGSVRAILAVNADPAGGATDANDPSAVKRWLNEASGSGPAAGGGVQWLSQEGSASSTEGASEPSVAPRDVFAQSGQGKDFSLALLILALGLGVFEVLLARRCSHAAVIDSPGAMRTAAGGVSAMGGVS